MQTEFVILFAWKDITAINTICTASLVFLFACIGHTSYRVSLLARVGRWAYYSKNFPLLNELGVSSSTTHTRCTFLRLLLPLCFIKKKVVCFSFISERLFWSTKHLVISADTRRGTAVVDPRCRQFSDCICCFLGKRVLMLCVITSGISAGVRKGNRGSSWRNRELFGT